METWLIFLEHSILNTILKEGYEKFSDIALEQRKNVNLPPFSHIGLLVLTSNNMNLSKSILNKLKEINQFLYMVLHDQKCQREIINIIIN